MGAAVKGTMGVEVGMAGVVVGAGSKLVVEVMLIVRVAQEAEVTKQVEGVLKMTVAVASTQSS